MARQDSIMPFYGTVDNMTFLKTADGYRVRKKRRSSASRSAQIKETMSKFGAAGTAGKLIRSSIRGLVNQSGDTRVTARLLKQLVSVINSDVTHDRGKRTVANGNIELLRGFEFNAKAPFDTVFYGTTNVTIDRVAGKIQLEIPAFVPVKCAQQPSGATHFQITLAAVELDFANLKSKTDIKESEVVPISIDQNPGFTLVASLPAGSIFPLLAIVGIEYFLSDGGKYYPLEERSVNALKLLEVSGA
jgi:hypothetical protein